MKEAKEYKTEYKQNISDDEMFDSAKINPNQLDKITTNKIIEAVVSFGEVLSDKKAYPYQREFILRIVRSLVYNDGETILGEFARQAGKSTSFEILLPSATTLLPLLAEKMFELKIDSPIVKFRKGLWVGVYGPDYDRASIIGRKINSAFKTPTSREVLSSNRIGMEFPEKVRDYLDKLPRGSFIKVKSANKRVSIEGDTFHLLITDETQEIDSYVIKKSMHPFLAATNGTFCMIGSAYNERVYFYDMIKMLKRDDIGIKNKLKRYFAANYRVVEKYNPNYKKYIEKEKKRLGEHSLEFKMSYELYWPVETGMFITEDKLLSEIGKDYGVAPFDKTNLHAIGIDVGKTIDSTVITVAEYDQDNPILVDKESGIYRYDKKIKNWLEIGGDDYDTQFYLICEFIKNYRWDVLAIDATGVGAALFDRLKNRFEPEGKTIIGFVFGLQSKSNGYSLLYREILAGRWSFPNSTGAKKLRKQQKFILQSSSLTKKNKGSYMIVAHVDEKVHDDFPDSWMLVNYAIESEDANIEKIEEVEESFYDVDLYSNTKNFLYND